MFFACDVLCKLLIVLNHFFYLIRFDFEYLFVVYHLVNFLDSVFVLHSSRIDDVISIQYHVATHTSSVAIRFIKSEFQYSSRYEVHILCFFSAHLCSTQRANDDSIWITITQSDILWEYWIQFLNCFLSWWFFCFAFSCHKKKSVR